MFFYGSERLVILYGRISFVNSQRPCPLQRGRPPNPLLDKRTDGLVNAQEYERSTDRQGYRSGHYERNFQTTAEEEELKVPKLKGIPFETAIIERYRRREPSVEEVLIEMYLAGVSVRRVEDITQALWRTRPLSGEYPYVHVDGVCLKHRWGGEIRNAFILVAIDVSSDG